MQVNLEPERADSTSMATVVSMGKYTKYPICRRDTIPVSNIYARGWRHHHAEVLSASMTAAGSMWPEAVEAVTHL